MRNSVAAEPRWASAGTGHPAHVPDPGSGSGIPCITDRLVLLMPLRQRRTGDQRLAAAGTEVSVISHLSIALRQVVNWVRHQTADAMASTTGASSGSTSRIRSASLTTSCAPSRNFDLARGWLRSNQVITPL